MILCFSSDFPIKQHFHNFPSQNARFETQICIRQMIFSVAFLVVITIFGNNLYSMLDNNINVMIPLEILLRTVHVAFFSSLDILALLLVLLL